MTTADKILDRLQSTCKIKPKLRGNVIRCSSPLRSDSDSSSFALMIDADGEHGGYIDFAGNDDKGSLYELASKLGIETPKNGHSATPISSYANLEAYAQSRGVSADVFVRAGWQDGMAYDRPALIYRTQTGERCRFIDGLKPKYMPMAKDMALCWYGLQKAIKLAGQHGTLFICNGEASTIIAQSYNIPACCVTGGEKVFTDELIADLQKAWAGKIAHILDSDEKGRATAKQRQAQVGGIIIDLNLFDKGDLADHCMLHEQDSLKELNKLVIAPTVTNALDTDSIVSMSDVANIMAQVFEGDTTHLHSMPYPVPISWDVMQPLLGEMAQAGQVIAIGSSSGSGKTMMLETWAYNNGLEGIPTLMISPEWQPSIFTWFMAVKIWKGTSEIPSFDSLMAFYRNMQHNHSTFDNNTRKAALQALNIVSHYDIDAYNIRVAKDSDLNKVLDRIRDRIQQRKKDGKPPYEMVMFDYVSVFGLDSEVSGNSEESKLGLFKDFCMAENVLGVTTVQVNKDSVRRVNTSGGILTGMDLYGVREDKYNYVVMSNRKPASWENMVAMGVIDLDSAIELSNNKLHKPYQDESGETFKTDSILYYLAKINVKASQYTAYGHFDFNRRLIRSGIAPNWQLDGRNIRYIPTIQDRQSQDRFNIDDV